MSEPEEFLEYENYTIESLPPFMVKKRKVEITREALPRNLMDLPGEVFSRSELLGVERELLATYWSGERAYLEKMWDTYENEYVKARRACEETEDWHTLGSLHEKIDQVYSHLTGFNTRGFYGEIPLEEFRIRTSESIEALYWWVTAGLVMFALEKQGHATTKKDLDVTKAQWKKWLMDTTETDENRGLVQFTRRILSNWFQFCENWNDKCQHVKNELKMSEFSSANTPLSLYGRANQDYAAWIAVSPSSRTEIAVEINAAPLWAKIGFRDLFEQRLRDEYGDPKNWEHLIDWDSWVVSPEHKEWLLRCRASSRL